jgi:hypothetical protein
VVVVAGARSAGSAASASARAPCAAGPAGAACALCQAGVRQGQRHDSGAGKKEEFLEHG